MSGIEIESESELTEPEIAAQSESPEELPGFQAVHWNGRKGVDLRPHVWDGIMKVWMLLDSGSQVTAFPPDPGDQAVPGQFLRAVNGSKIKCYGQKKIEIRIGRKTYGFNAIKADVESPVLGWDFVRAHRLELAWNDFGDQMVVDKKTKSSTILKFKAMI